MRPEREARLRDLEEALGHHFADLALLDRALTHTSRSKEDPEARHNEPLEFLGDAVLGFLVSDLLHRRDPEGHEGGKSRSRAHLVSAVSLAKRAQALGLPPLLLLGRGEEKTGGRGKGSLWADAYEAVIAVLYLDGGLEAARSFVERAFADELGPSQASIDPKSALQEALQGRGETVPLYEVLAEEGPSHRRRFRVGCIIEGKKISEGEGFSKKEAEQVAARRALEVLPTTRSSPHPGKPHPSKKRPPGPA